MGGLLYSLSFLDVHEHLNIGKLLNLGDAVRKTQNLVKLLSAAVSYILLLCGAVTPIASSFVAVYNCDHA